MLVHVKYKLKNYEFLHIIIIGYINYILILQVSKIFIFLKFVKKLLLIKKENNIHLIKKITKN